MHTQYITGSNQSHLQYCVSYSTGYWAESGNEATTSTGTGMGMRLPPILEQDWELDYHQYWNKTGN